MPGLESLRQRGLSGWCAAERAADRVFGSATNPLRHLGAIAMLAFWLVASSGVVLYVVFETSVAEAHASVAALEHWPLQSGRLLRGLHRYASDLLVLALALHLVREWLAGHERGARRFAWLTGVALIGFVFVAAIGGFWLNWDQLGQYSAIATAEWIDALPMLLQPIPTPFATPFARNFLAGAVDDRLFSLFVFVHIGVTLLLLFGLWFHVQRLTRPAVWPPRAVATGFGVGLIALALVQPVVSHAPASLNAAPQALRLDWLLLFAHPLVDTTSAAFAWALVAAAALLLFGLPFVPVSRTTAALDGPPSRAPVAVVDAANCNGCRRCLADCPYAAVTMVPHPNQRIGRTLAVVDADLCTACGLCAGACPSSTPFRSGGRLVTGIDLPQRPVDDVRRELQAGLAAARDHRADRAERAERADRADRAERPLVVFGCERGADSTALAAGDVNVTRLLCAGQLPPSFVEYALRDGAAGVLVAACNEGGCEFRFGERLVRERLAGQREPHLRAGVPAERIELVFAGRGDEGRLVAALERLRRRVAGLTASATPPHGHSAAGPSGWRHA